MRRPVARCLRGGDVAPMAEYVRRERALCEGAAREGEPAGAAPTGKGAGRGTINVSRLGDAAAPMKPALGPYSMGETLTR